MFTDPLQEQLNCLIHEIELLLVAQNRFDIISLQTIRHKRALDYYIEFGDVNHVVYTNNEEIVRNPVFYMFWKTLHSFKLWDNLHESYLFEKLLSRLTTTRNSLLE